MVVVEVSGGRGWSHVSKGLKIDLVLVLRPGIGWLLAGLAWREGRSEDGCAGLLLAVNSKEELGRRRVVGSLRCFHSLHPRPGAGSTASCRSSRQPWLALGRRPSVVCTDNSSPLSFGHEISMQSESAKLWQILQ